VDQAADGDADAVNSRLNPLDNCSII